MPKTKTKKPAKAKPKPKDLKPGLTLERLKLTDIHQDPTNAREHSQKNIDAIAANLQNFHQYKNIVVQKSTMKILAGNGTYAAMQKLGWKECDCFMIDLDDKKARALAIADNRTAELAVWDRSVLLDHLGQFQLDTDFDIELEDLGFDESDMEELMKGLGRGNFGDGGGEGSGEGKKEKTCTCPSCGYEWSGK